ncbi:uncharacterized protein SCODWIG_02880 [Saccharomycodes ludwigii]|uniref:Uncharacterized protein n=1 Tax=Saccharomycodes ludwigii TaxID=36035 RepID=A0A376B972_9ASCO|nr:uncharacterized protein SCODWIG_02880 [Saccharomycodes ludwigii]
MNCNNRDDLHVSFSTNGMFILDDIDNSVTGKKYMNIVGGAGTYATLGASVVARHNSNRNPAILQFIVDCGRDFYDVQSNNNDNKVNGTDIEEKMRQWNFTSSDNTNNTCDGNELPGLIFRYNADRLTTKGYNEYGANDFRTFKYLTPKLQITSEDILQNYCLENNNSRLKKIEIMHLVCSPKRCKKIIKDLVGSDVCNRFVWEPVPDLCNQENYQDIYDIMHNILDSSGLPSPSYEIILSPNAEEGSRLFGYEHEPVTIEECLKLMVKDFNDFIGYSANEINRRNGIVLRCGVLGCLLLLPHNLNIYHLPAYHSITSTKVIDPTGGGNAFLGGFAMGLVIYCNDWYKAAICGNIAAGIAIEQVGALPDLKVIENNDGTDGNNKSLFVWNGCSFQERIQCYFEKYEISGSTSSF